MPRATATERLARRLVAELGAIAGDRPMQWVMLDDVMRALGVTWEEAEQAADFAAAQGWVEHRMHSLLLREPAHGVGRPDMDVAEAVAGSLGVSKAEIAQAGADEPRDGKRSIS
jgi:hypothetical protein